VRGAGRSQGAPPGGSPSTGSPVESLRREIAQAAAVLRDGDSESSAPQTPTLERPPRAEFGDYSTNVALLLAPSLKAPPREIAERVGETLSAGLGDTLDRVEVAGPGFLNVFLSDSWFRRSLELIRSEGERFGAGTVPETERQRMLVEFVSANPTGPITVASGRHAAYGDALARVLEFVGHAIEREYYLNDYGTQIDLFGQSIAARMRGEEPPEEGYRGDYVVALAERIEREGIEPTEKSALVRRGIELMVEQASATLERFRVRFDRYFSERSLHEDGLIEAAIEALGGGYAYHSEGATWLRTSAFGDDKDRVLRRSSGELTYFASDIAYHQNKRERGYDRLINVLGADHHGYVARMRAVFASLGEEDRFEAVIMQLVNVVERGARAQMSKRKGEFVTLDDLIDDIGVDAARFFLVQRSHDTPLDLDLDLARERSQDNPVYYVQYAHARIASILRNAGDERLERARGADLSAGGFDRARLEPAERTLIKRLLELPEEVSEAAARRAPHRLTVYAHELASDFHAFYRDCHVVGVEPEELEDLRLCLCDSARGVIASVLSLLGIEAPESM
jgi:arginyl-tRNA synthetase